MTNVGEEILSTAVRTCEILSRPRERRRSRGKGVKFGYLIMKPKRNVSANLGRTQHRRADNLYVEIRKRIGPTRRCPFYGGSKYPQFSPEEHNKLNPGFPNPNVPIEQFDFAKKGSLWDLQAYCKVCYKAHRDARIKKSRAAWFNLDSSPMEDNEIRKWYRKNVGEKMKCSACLENLNPDKFPISRSMEKGLHNECFDCQAGRGSSVREQEWLADGNWSSWTKNVLRMRKLSKVKCAGWSRSVAAEACLQFDTGKHMHADHIIPLRAGGIHDAKNFQPLCESCNEKKSDQIDPILSVKKIRKLVGLRYNRVFKDTDSISTIERKLKSAVVNNIEKLISNKEYLNALKKRKKEVNGQWNVERAYRKGTEWFSRKQAGYEK